MPALLVATKNTHKTAEIRVILGNTWKIEDLTAHPEIVSPEETGVTFAENATLKAVGASRIFNDLVLADDSGLEVDALGGAPGVFSARYAGVNASDSENRALLLTALSKSENRRARFRCVLVLARNGCVLAQFEGAVEGEIAEAERGSGGFGYDALFIPSGRSETFGELPQAVKNELSHRGSALQKLKRWLENIR
jgi:XTP/dITP diphosphohydrolase